MYIEIYIEERKDTVLRVGLQMEQLAISVLSATISFRPVAYKWLVLVPALSKLPNTIICYGTCLTLALYIQIIQDKPFEIFQRPHQLHEVPTKNTNIVVLSKGGLQFSRWVFLRGKWHFQMCTEDNNCTTMAFNFFLSNQWGYLWFYERLLEILQLSIPSSQRLLWNLTVHYSVVLKKPLPNFGLWIFFVE